MNPNEAEPFDLKKERELVEEQEPALGQPDDTGTRPPEDQDPLLEDDEDEVERPDGLLEEGGYRGDGL